MPATIDIAQLRSTALAMVADNRGLLAMDESDPTCNQRFAKAGIPQTAEMRRQYRDLIATTPGLSDSIAAAILFDETLRQRGNDGRPIADILRAAGIIPGIKVDLGAKDLPGFPGEKVTEGLDGLAGRLAEYAKLGARFAKWRAVIVIGEGIPTAECLEINAHALARYAAACHAAGIVPMVEPEALMDGDHTIEQCAAATRAAVRAVFDQLRRQRVDTRGVVLKPNMVLSGKESRVQAGVEQVADATVEVLLDATPANVPAVAFLSGGQSGEDAAARLNAMKVRHRAELPWALTYSFSRAIQYPALKIWAGQDANRSAAQAALLHRAWCCREACRGEYRPEMEKAVPPKAKRA